MTFAEMKFGDVVAWTVSKSLLVMVLADEEKQGRVVILHLGGTHTVCSFERHDWTKVSDDVR